MSDGKDAQLIKELEREAALIIDLKKKNLSRRPIVIEFCGSPKAGKSSCISSLDIFLRRNGFRTKVLTERASVCPIKNKHDPLFNIWSSCSSLAQMIEMVTNHSRDYDIVILDRGVFDGLCWLVWQKNEMSIRDEDYKRFTQFLTAPRWRMIIDLIFIFRVPPDTSLNREYKNLLTRKEGSIMRKPILDQYLIATHQAENRFKKNFRHVLEVKTENITQNEVSYDVTKKCLEVLEDVTKERIAIIENKFIAKKFKKPTKKLSLFLNDLEGKIEFNDRDLIEEDPKFVQPVPLAIIKDRNSFSFLLAKKKKEAIGPQSPEKDKYLLYFGGHMREEDFTIFPDHPSFKKILHQSLYREIHEELGLDINIQKNQDPICIWIKEHERSVQHLAIAFLIEKDLKKLKVQIDEREFLKTSQKGLHTGSILTEEKLIEYYDEIDDWSKLALHQYYPQKMKEIVESIPPELQLNSPKNNISKT